MVPSPEMQQMSRRDLLKTGAGVGAALIAGTGFVASTTASWAVEVKALKPKTMATLIQMARDVYPHDRVADKFYAIAVKSHDDKAAEDEAHKTLIEEGIANLDGMAAEAGAAGYADIGWEADRTALLHKISDGGFFQAVRGGLVTGLYNQKELWPLFGYEGASSDKGGYIERGFDDINWL